MVTAGGGVGSAGESSTSRYLAARAEAARRAPEVFALLFAAEDAAGAVRGVARLLDVDATTARSVLAQWSADLSRAGRQAAQLELERFERGEDRELNSSWLVGTSD